MGQRPIVQPGILRINFYTEYYVIKRYYVRGHLGKFKRILIQTFKKYFL